MVFTIVHTSFQNTTSLIIELISSN